MYLLVGDKCQFIESALGSFITLSRFQTMVNQMFLSIVNLFPTIRCLMLQT